VLEIPVLKFNNITAELLLLDLIEGGELSLLIASVVEQFLDCDVPFLVEWI